MFFDNVDRDRDWDEDKDRSKSKGYGPRAADRLLTATSILEVSSEKGDESLSDRSSEADTDVISALPAPRTPVASYDSDRGRTATLSSSSAAMASPDVPDNVSVMSSATAMSAAQVELLMSRLDTLETLLRRMGIDKDLLDRTLGKAPGDAPA
jgi:hypothetical protein